MRTWLFLKKFDMENSQLSRDQVSTNVRGNPVNGVKVPSRVFIGHSSPAQVARTTDAKRSSSPNGSKEACGSAVLTSGAGVEISESLLTSTPSASQTARTAPSGGTTANDGPQRKAVFSRNAASVDRRSNELCGGLKSSSVISSCSPASLGNGNHGSKLSPGSLSNGNHSAGMSTSDSIFTYSLTDDSHDELDELDCKGDRENETKEKTLDSTGDAKTADLQDESNIPVSCDNNFVDKIAQVKNVIQKEYIHTITYTFDDLTSFEKSRSILNAELCELCQSQDDEQLLQTLKKTHKNLSSADQKELSHKKFSSRSVKHFLKSMSPGSRHRKPSRSSESASSRSSNTLAGSLDSVSVNEDLEETGATLEMTHKTNVSLKKSPGIGKKSPAVSHLPHGQKPKGTTCDPVTNSLKAGEANLSGD